MAAVVGADHGVASGNGLLREAVVATYVLGGTMHYLDHHLRCAGRQPAPVVDGGAVGCGEGLPVFVAGCRGAGATGKAQTGGEREHGVAAVILHRSSPVEGVLGGTVNSAQP
jgi:hypothetical protein